MTKQQITLDAFKDLVDDHSENCYGKKLVIATKAFIDGLDKEDLFEALCYATDECVDLEFVRDFPEYEQDYNPQDADRQHFLREQLDRTTDLFANPIR